MLRLNRFCRIPAVVFLVLVFLACRSNAEPLTIHHNHHHFSLENKVQYLVDRRGDMTFDEIYTGENNARWLTTSGEIFNKGFTSDVYWFRFSFENQSISPSGLLLEVGYPLLDSIDFYMTSTDSEPELVKHYHAGDMLPYAERLIDHPNFVFPITTTSHSTFDIFIRVQTTSSMQVPLKLWTRDEFLGKQQPELLFMGLLIGVMAIMSVYNLFLFFAVKDKSYLFFVVCLVNYALVIAILMGIAFPYLWPNSVWWNDKSLVVSACLTMTGLSQFSKYFLNMEINSPRGKRLLDACSISLIALAIGSLFLPYFVTIQITAAFVIIAPLTAYLAGIKIYRKGIVSARIFVIAFSSLVVTTIVFALNKYGILPRSNFSEISMHLSSIVVICLLSLALADRINTERRDKVRHQQRAIENLDKYRQLYEDALEGIFRMSSDGKPLAVNPAFIKLVGATSKSDFFTRVTNLADFVSGGPEKFKRFVSLIKARQKVVDYEVEAMKLDGTCFCGVIFARAVGTDSQSFFIEGSIIDITERKQSEQRLNYLAHHDPLTDLINRNEFETRVENALIQSKQDDSEHALLYMDLDQFKFVNDTSGHDAGDELLRQIALLFRRHIRQHDSLARLGGDEFGLLLEGCSLEKASEIAQCIRMDINEYHFVWETQPFSVGISIGLVPINAGSISFRQLLKLADAACYEAKNTGRNRVIVYDDNEGDLEQRQTEMNFVSSLGDSIKNNDLVLYQQKIEALGADNNNGMRYEILVRLVKNGQIIPPGAFLPAAERYNKIKEIDCWVVSTYFKWLADNPNHYDNLTLASINLSGLSLSDRDFLCIIQDLFKNYDISADKICFEITESAAISNLKNTLEFLNCLKDSGVRFALDDFGSGFSSYGYLKTLPVDYVKIEGSFVRDIVTDPIDYAMVKSITDIAHAMELDVVAEFVENQAIYAKLKDVGANFVQGYYIAPPQPLANVINETRALVPQPN